MPAPPAAQGVTVTSLVPRLSSMRVDEAVVIVVEAVVAHLGARLVAARIAGALGLGAVVLVGARVATQVAHVAAAGAATGEVARAADPVAAAEHARPSATGGEDREPQRTPAHAPRISRPHHQEQVLAS